MFHPSHRFPHLTWLVPFAAGILTYLLALGQTYCFGEPECSLIAPTLAVGAVILGALIVLGLRLFLYFYNHEVAAAGWIPLAFSLLMAAILGSMMASARTGMSTSESLMEIAGSDAESLSLMFTIILGAALAIVYVMLEKRRLAFRPAVITGLVLLIVAFLTPLVSGLLLGRVVERDVAFVNDRLPNVRPAECAQLTVTYARTRCFEAAAITTGDTRLCPPEPYGLPDCVAGVAAAKQDYAICAELAASNMIWALGDIEMTDLPRLQCYGRVAAARGDARAPCEQLYAIDPARAQDCMDLTAYMARQMTRQNAQ